MIKLKSLLEAKFLGFGNQGRKQVKEQTDVTKDDYKKNTITQQEKDKRLTGIEMRLKSKEDEFIGEEVDFKEGKVAGPVSYFREGPAKILDINFFKNFKAGDRAYSGENTGVEMELEIEVEGGSERDYLRIIANRDMLKRGKFTVIVLGGKARSSRNYKWKAPDIAMALAVHPTLPKIYNGDLGKLLLSKFSEIEPLLLQRHRLNRMTIVKPGIKFQATGDTERPDSTIA
mgnify:CR=1 FL=1